MKYTTLALCVLFAGLTTGYVALSHKVARMAEAQALTTCALAHTAAQVMWTQGENVPESYLIRVEDTCGSRPVRGGTGV